MALQIVKTSYNGSVDFTKRVVRLPEPDRIPGMKQPARKQEPSRLDSLKLAIAGLPMAVLSMAAVPALAGIPIQTISDGNTNVTIDPINGVTGWTVNGVQQLNVDQFYYRIGASNGQSLLSSGSTVTPTQPTAMQADLAYTNAGGGFNANAVYKVAAGSLPTDQSLLTEDVTVTNTTNAPLALHFYKYADFNLNGQSANQTVNITNGNTADQHDVSGFAMSDTVGQGGAGNPTEVQASSGGALLTSLTSGSPYTLNGTTSAGPGDVSFGFEWDVTLAAAGSPNSSDTFQVSVPSTIQPVPEPASLGLAVAASGLLLTRRRRKATVAGA